MAKIGQMVKQGMVEELTQELGKRPNVFVTGISRMTAGDAGDLRKRLHASQARMIVVKRRLGLRALDQMKLASLAELLEGSIGLVFSSEDPSPIAKELFDFVKEHEGQLTLRGGLLEGQVLDQKRVEKIAKLPGKPQLLAEVVGTLEAPLQDVVTTVERLLGDLAYAIEELAKQRPTEPNQDSKGEAPKAKPEEKAQADAETTTEQPKAGESGSAGAPQPNQESEPKSEQEPPTEKREGDA